MIAYISIATNFTVQIRRFAEQIWCRSCEWIVKLSFQRGVFQQLEALGKSCKNLINHGNVVRWRPDVRPLVVVELCIHIDVGRLVILQLMSQWWNNAKCWRFYSAISKNSQHYHTFRFQMQFFELTCQRLRSDRFYIRHTSRASLPKSRTSSSCYSGLASWDCTTFERLFRYLLESIEFWSALWRNHIVHHLPPLTIEVDSIRSR